MSTRTTKLLTWLIALGIVLACVPSLATPVPAADPNAINTFIAQTVNAASTQTAAALPTSTPTATFTPTPRNTETLTPTATATVIFILSSPTKPVIPTLTGSIGDGTISDNFACKVISVNPANGTTFGSRADFDATWKIGNIGKKAWDRNTIDYAYTSGAKIHKVASYDLGSNVKVGETVNIVVDMEAPKNAGTYTTTWTLRSGAKVFCNMSLTIVVN